MTKQAYGIPRGISVTFIPIETVGLGFIRQHIVWLFERRRVRVNKPFNVPRPNGGSYIIPAGFEFDGGSIPRWLLVTLVALIGYVPMHDYIKWVMTGVALLGLLIDSYGLMLYAFAVHDFGVRYGLLITEDGNVETLPTVGNANNVMRRVNFATNDMLFLGLLAHAAVALGAGFAWRKYRKGRTVPDISWRAFDYGRHCFKF